MSRSFWPAGFLKPSIIVARDRAAGLALLTSRGCDLMLLDDGQTAVIPTWQVLVIGAESPDVALLPLGPLREPLSALRGDELVWLHGDARKHPAAPRRAFPDRGREYAAGRPIFAFAGIAGPERFFRTLSEADRGWHGQICRSPASEQP